MNVWTDQTETEYKVFCVNPDPKHCLRVIQSCNAMLCNVMLCKVMLYNVMIRSVL